MPCYEKRTYCGHALEVEMYHSIRPAGTAGKRSKNITESCERQKQLNTAYAKKRFALIVNGNFNNGDLHTMLTYPSRRRKKAPTQEEARKHMDRFLRRLRDYCRKRHIVLKYIVVDEMKDGVPHHHLIASGVSAETVRQMWQHGICKVSWLYSEPDFTSLAYYLAKQFESDPTGRRWRSSRNIDMPRVERRQIRRIPRTDKAMLPADLRDDYRIIAYNRECSELTGESLRMMCERIERDKSPPGDGSGTKTKQKKGAKRP